MIITEKGESQFKMKKIILYNPAVSSLNLGDEIIFEGVKDALRPLLADNYIIHVSTHLPVSRFYADLLGDADARYVCGSNLLRNYYRLNFRQWDINLLNAKKLAPCVLVGVGWHKEAGRIPAYTKRLYQTMLDREKIHSVRDSYTKQRLLELGFENVINTGCPTMWKLTPAFCKDIPSGKAKEAVFTLTDYNIDAEKDVLVVKELKKAYDKVYVWLQGANDYQCAKQLGLLDHVELIPPSLSAYDSFLSTHDVDYIGTRLHGGIRALQHKRRSMILAVDTRATEKKADFNLPVTERSQLDQDVLEHIMFDSRETNITIPEKEIALWKQASGIL